MRALSVGTFVREGRAAATLGAGRSDRLRLWGCQIASSLRYRAPRYVERRTITPTIIVGARRIITPVRFGADDWLAFRQVFVDRDYDCDLGQPVRILDAGANCGYAALWLAARFPAAELAVLEPHPANAAALRQNLARNRVVARVIDAALSTTNGHAFLCTEGLSTSFTLRERPLLNESCVEVVTCTMSRVLDDLGWDQVDLLKIDIEGSERDLFRGAPSWLDRVQRIVGEIHGTYRAADLASDLAPRGFACDVRERRRTGLFLARRLGLR